MRLTRGAALFCLAAGAAIPVLWGALLATGQVSDLDERAIAYAFHWTAEGLTAGLLVGAGITGLRGLPAARRLFFFSGGMLGIAALGMLVYYALLGEPAFVVTGTVVTGLTVFFMHRNRASMTDGVHVTVGAVLYVLLTAGGNALHSGDTLSAVYLLAALGVAATFSVALFRRPG